MPFLGDAFAHLHYQHPLSSTPLNLRDSTSSTHLPSPTFPTSPLFSQPLLTTLYLIPTLSPPQNHPNPRQTSLTRPQRLQIDSAALRATRGESSGPHTAVIASRWRQSCTDQYSVSLVEAQRLRN
jgi:hypothetical protein